MTETITAPPQEFLAPAQKPDLATEEEIPFATALRKAIHQVHDLAARSEFTTRFLKGEVDREEYAVFLNALYFVYSAIEEMLEKHKDHEVVKLFYFPHELSRKTALRNDLIFYYGEDRIAEVTDPKTMSPVVAKYVRAIRQAGERDPIMLVAHSYTRYLGDLNGGRTLAMRLKKWILKLEQKNSEWESTEGLEFYDFENIPNEKEFINHYREQLNQAKFDDETKELFLKETIDAFHLNIEMFAEVPVVLQQKKTTDVSSTFPWGAAAIAVAATVAAVVSFRRFARS